MGSGAAIGARVSGGGALVVVVVVVGVVVVVDPTVVVDGAFVDEAATSLLAVSAEPHAVASRANRHATTAG